jgi:hypothetical protein
MQSNIHHIDHFHQQYIFMCNTSTSRPGNDVTSQYLFQLQTLTQLSALVLVLCRRCGGDPKLYHHLVHDGPMGATLGSLSHHVAGRHGMCVLYVRARR